MKTQLLVHPEELSKKWIDRAAKIGLNSLGIHPWGGGTAVQSLDELVKLLKTDEYRARIDYARSLGIEVEYECHALSYLLPRDLFDTHPEYFRMDKDGKRVQKGDFCVSNTDALDIVAKNAARLADDLYGSGDRFYFWMDDTKDRRCSCEKCRALSLSDQQLIFVNAMIREIKKTRPDAKMAYLAYQGTIPVPEKIKPEKGVFLEYAPFEKYTAKGPEREMLIARERAMIQPLFDFFGKEDAKLLEYWYDNSLFSKWKKPPVEFKVNKSAMLCDLIELAPFDFEVISSFACFLGEDYEALYGCPDVNDFDYNKIRKTKMVQIKKDGVYLDGKKFFLISGDFHYFRTLPQGWKRRLELMRDFGLSAVSTYVPWNLHESKKGEFYFENNADIVRFIKTADECGLKVILRLSPYLCGEWEMGGLPAWLLTDRTIGLRTSDPTFMKHVTEYTRVLAEKIRPYLYTNGGPIILVGAENEYGSYGNDKEYLKQLCALYRELGIDVPFISANGSDPFKYNNGTLKQNWNGIDLGANIKAMDELDRLEKYQPDKPLFIGEAWVGNIQFWGKSLKVNRGAERNAEFLKATLERNTVVNFYMFVGGTNFGFYNGALAVNEQKTYTPLMTSYDYDAPISEEGLLRDKYFYMRDVLDDYLGKPRRPHIQPEYESQSIEGVKYTEFAPLLDNTKNIAVKTLDFARPVCMEDIGQNYGFIRYTTKIEYTDDRERTLYIDGLADRAYVYLNGKLAGVYMRDCNNTPVKFTVPEGGLELSILLENTGRINYGYKIYDRKGIDTVRVDIQNPDGSYLYNFACNTNFKVESLPLETLDGLEYSDALPNARLPVFCKAEFKAKAGVDTFIDMRGHNKGVVFVNGFNVGRFWHVGPQQTLYIPGELLKETNTLEILELEFDPKKAFVDFIERPILTEIEQEDRSTDGFELK